jgi:hypothetical protein
MSSMWLSFEPEIILVHVMVNILEYIQYINIYIYIMVIFLLCNLLCKFKMCVNTLLDTEQVEILRKVKQ